MAKSILHNLAVQSALTTLLFAVVISVVVVLVLNHGVAREQELLILHGESMRAGTMQMSDPFTIARIQEDVRDHQRLVTIVMVGGLFALFLVSTFVVWRGWRVVIRQQATIRRLDRVMFKGADVQQVPESDRRVIPRQPIQPMGRPRIRFESDGTG
jgi:hypothetical protein